MDLGFLGQITFNWDFVVGFFSIIIINLILSGDNAVVIALAVRSLSRKQRIRGIAFGSALAVLLRVILTFFAAQLLEMQFVKFIGGAFILWISVKLFVEGTSEEESHKEAKTIWQAIWVIIVADITMSLDNVLGVAAASKGNLFLLVFGLGLSIPFVVFTSNLLSMLMDKYPILVYLGAAVLGRVGGEMIITDPFVTASMHPSNLFQNGFEAFCTVGVLVAGKAWVKWKIIREGRVPRPAALERPVPCVQKIETLGVVTISREYKNGCVEIGQAVARQLGYEFVDKHCIYSNLRAV
jgi:YjbE family integral membrane protein